MAPEDIRRAGRAGARAARAGQRARQRARAPRVPVHRHARCGQDHHRAHLRQVPQLRDAASAPSRAAVCASCREIDAGRFVGPHRGRRRLAHQGRRHARAARQRAVRAGARPLQGVPHRRGAHALDALLQRAAEDARGAAAAREVPARHHRPAEAAGDRAVALPAVQPQAPAGGGDRRAPAPHPRAERACAFEPRGAAAAWRRRPMAACATRCRCSTS